MHKNLRRIFCLFFLVTYTIINTSNFELYNAQPYTLYYMIQNTQLCNHEEDPRMLEAHAYVNVQIDTPLHLIILKEFPTTSQTVPVIICEPQQATTNIYVKTYESRNGTITLIPQSKQSLHEAQTAGGLKLKNCITPYEIWKSTCTYTPPHKNSQQDIAEIQKESEDILPSSSDNEPESYIQPSDPITNITPEDSSITETQPEEPTSDCETETNSEITLST